jgi:hypothetical protein
MKPSCALSRIHGPIPIWSPSAITGAASVMPRMVALTPAIRALSGQTNTPSTNPYPSARSDACSRRRNFSFSRSDNDSGMVACGLLIPSISTSRARHRSTRPITTPISGNMAISRIPIRIGLSSALTAAIPPSTAMVTAPTGTDVNRYA